MWKTWHRYLFLPNFRYWRLWKKSIANKEVVEVVKELRKRYLEASRQPTFETEVPLDEAEVVEATAATEIMDITEQGDGLPSPMNSRLKRKKRLGKLGARSVPEKDVRHRPRTPKKEETARSHRKAIRWAAKNWETCSEG